MSDEDKEIPEDEIEEDEDDDEPEISSLVFTKDGLCAKYWIPPVLRKRKKKEEDSEPELIEITDNTFDEWEKDLKERTIKEGYHKVIPLELEEEIDIVEHLRRDCKIEEGTTLRQIMSYVRKNKWLCEFISRYCWAGGNDGYHAQLDDPVEKSKNVRDIVIQWFPEEFYTEDGKPKHEDDEEPEVKLHHDLSGLGPQGENDFGADPNEDIRWGVSACGDIRDIANCPVIIKEEVEFTQCDFKSDKDKKIEQISLLKGTADFTLLEILDAIYWEINWYGGPARTKAMFEDVLESKELCEQILEKEKKDAEQKNQEKDS